jgi:hypothetical protein
MVKILQKRFLRLNFEFYKKTHFVVSAKKISQAMDEVEKVFGHFLNPWALRMSGIGCYA